MLNLNSKFYTFLLIVLTTLYVILYQSGVIYSHPCGKEYFSGIDVSSWQGDIDWPRVKKSGKVQFAIIRTSYGWSNWDKFTDSQLDKNIKGAKSVGIPIGAYHYSYATNTKEALLEAEFFIDRLKRTKWEYPVFMDVEDSSLLKLTNQQRTDIIVTFLEKVEKAGYYVGIYTNLNWSINYLDMKRLSRFDVWMAQWGEKCNSKYPYGIWQRSNNGSIPGIKGSVDLNVCHVDYPKIIKERRLNGYRSR